MIKTISTLKNLSALLIEQGSRHLLGLFVLPYILRLFDPSVYGPLLIAQAFAALLAILADYGLNYTAVQTIAENRLDSHHRSRTSWEVLTIRSTLTLMLWPIYFLGLYLANVPMIYAFIAYLPVIASVTFPNWIFQGVEQMVWPARLQIIGQITYVLMIFMFVHKGDTPVTVAEVQSGVALLTTLVAWVFIQKSVLAIYWVRPLLIDLIRTIQHNLPIMLGIAASIVFTSGNIFIIGAWGLTAIAGLYGIAWKFFTVLITFIGQLQVVLYPRISRLRKENEQLASIVFKKYLYLGLFISVGLSFTVYFIFPFVLPLITGKNYAKSLPLLQILAYSLPLFTFNSMLTNFLFLNKKKYWLFTSILLITAIWDIIILNGLLYLKVSPTDFSWAYVSTEAVESLLLIVLTIFFKKEPKDGDQVKCNC